MKRISIILILASFVITSCSVIRSFENLSRLKYKIDSAADYKVQGISLSNKRSLKDFTSVEMLKLTAGFLKGTLPLSFILNIEAKNPGETDNVIDTKEITLAKFPYKLFLNDREIIQGDIEKPIYIPGRGASIIIPLRVEFDIVKSFKEKNLDDILLFLLQAGGVNGSTSNIKLRVKPALGTPVGIIPYPDEITIVDKTFN